MMTIFGITGQTGAGKSTLLQVIAQQGGMVIDCDKVYWEILANNTALQQALSQAFGDIQDEAGGIDRKKLGAVVFQDTGKLEMLNEITHPYVLNQVEANIQTAKETGVSMVGIDAIGLIESGLHHRCHWVLAVVAEESLRVARIMARDNISQDYAEQRVRAQQPEAFYRDYANQVLENHFPSKEAFFAVAEEAIATHQQEGTSKNL